MTKNCKHCHELFESRRSNHVYCTTSCKTKASYKRNNYIYVSGHYQKDELIVVNPENKMASPNDILESLKALESRIDNLKPTAEINGTAISNSALGSATADAAVFAAKKLFAPNSLPATKGDIEKLKRSINDLRNLLQNTMIN